MPVDLQLRKQSLQDAFQVFNQVSEQLVGSYDELKSRVNRLTRELAIARSERLEHLAEKERLADRLSSLLDALPAGVVVLDDQGRLRDCNPAAVELLGESNRDDTWEQIRNRICLSRDAGNGDLRLRNGRLVSVLRRRLEKEPGCILLLLDVTENRALQQQVARQERLSALGEMAAQLAHQIRTPLSAAFLYTGHLTGPGLENTHRERLGAKLRSRLQHMECQVNEMLAFSRGEALYMESLSVNEILREFVNAVETQLDEAGASLELADESGGDAWIKGNREALHGALSNLTTNALQHAGKVCRLTLELTHLQDRRIQLRFRDNGPGISRGAREKIFEPFFSTRSDGTGLGLAVVQSVVLAHGGTIGVDETADEGACFVMRFPIIRNDEWSVAQSKGKHSSSSTEEPNGAQTEG